MSTYMETKPLKEHNFFTALLPLIVLIALLIAGVMQFGSDSSAGPNQVSLFICAMLACFIGLWRGQHYNDIERGIVQGISTALGSSLILLFIGALIGVWTLSGTVPTLIYYGIQIINPSWFYTCTIIVSAIVAVTIGSSWTTSATIGVAFIGMAQALDMNLAITAGAIISGAYFGDKISPLSETTNLAAAVAETDLFAHIRNMMWTTVPSITIATIIFTLIGFCSQTSSATVQLQTELLNNLNSSFHISLLNLIPMVVLILMAIRKVPALITIFCGIVIGAIEAMILQPNAIANIFASNNDFGSNLINIWKASFDGIEFHSANEDMNQLLSGGGMRSMLNTIFLIIAALSFGAAMETTGALSYIFGFLIKIANKVSSLVICTILTCISTNVMTGDQYMSIIMPGRIFKSSYRKLNLHNTALSRSLEDGATITSVLVPWNTCAVYISGVLGVSTFAYLPYCYFNLINPILAIIFAIFGIKISRNVNNKDPKNSLSK